MAAYLVRHAHAGSRKAWDQPDQLRPLSKKGRGDAERIADLFDGWEVGRVLSSPAIRCVQTVQPLATRRSLRVEESPLLFEAADPSAALALLHEHADEHPVLCSHGDLLPDLVRLLQLRGMDIVGSGGNRKGSVWVLTADGDRFTKAEYHEL